MIESIRSHVCDTCGARTGSPTGDGLPPTRSEVAIKLGRQATDGTIGRILRDLIVSGRIREDKPAGRSAQYVAIGPDVTAASADYPGSANGGA